MVSYEASPTVKCQLSFSWVLPRTDRCFGISMVLLARGYPSIRPPNNSDKTTEPKRAREHQIKKT